MGRRSSEPRLLEAQSVVFVDVVSLVFYGRTSGVLRFKVNLNKRLSALSTLQTPPFQMSVTVNVLGSDVEGRGGAEGKESGGDGTRTWGGYLVVIELGTESGTKDF